MKKIISFILALCVMLTSVSFIIAQETTRVSISDMEVVSGEAISVPVNIANNINGVSILDLNVEYDSSLFTYTGYEQGLYKGTVSVNGTAAGVIKLSSMSIENYYGDGALVTFNFMVNEDISITNVLSEIKLIVNELYYYNDVYDSINIDREVNSGAVTINKSDASIIDTTASTTDATETTTASTTNETTTTAAPKETETTTVPTTEATETTTVPTTEATEATTEATEITTADTAETTETTTAAVRVSSGGGGGGSSRSIIKTTAATTETTTETTTEAVTEEASETTTETAIHSDVKVTIGSRKVTVGNEVYNMDAEPYIQTGSNSTMVPLRFVSIAVLGDNVENADASELIQWDGDTKTAVILVGNMTIKFTAGSNDIIIGSNVVSMDYGVKAEIKDGRMYIPFRALGSALGVSVDWNGDTKTASFMIK